jgi:SAM-dependent methyltransferase
LRGLVGPQIEVGFLMDFRCWRCDGWVELEPGIRSRACPGCGATYEERNGIFDLLPPVSAPPPNDPFEGAYGLAYDTTMRNREWLILFTRMVWGIDLGAMFSRMTAGANCGPGETVLDVPVGGGASIMPDATIRGRLIGVDRSLAMLERAAGRRRAAQLDSNVLLLRGDACRLPLADSSVDRALCFNGLHVIPDHRAVLQELSRVLKSDGTLVGATLVSNAPIPSSLGITAATLAGFLKPPSSTWLAEEAGSAGFVTWTEQKSGPLLLFEAAKAKRRRGGAGARRRIA